MKRDFLITMDLPNWARWYAMDKNGEWHCYENKPRPDSCEFSMWVSLGKLQFLFDFNMADINWTQTLHEIEVAG